MSLKSKLVAAAVALTLLGGVITAHAPCAKAATAQCGQRCIAIFSDALGTANDPRFVEGVSRGTARVGQPTILERASSANGAEDLLPHLGLVSDLFRAGLVSAAVNQHYGSLHAIQVEYAPNGVATGLCVGLATAAYQYEALTLQRCSVSARTVWIADTADSPATAAQQIFPLVNATTSNFSHPFAMTFARRAGLPAPIYVHTLKFVSGGPQTRLVSDHQLWGTKSGVL
jgi:hypothetical protein